MGEHKEHGHGDTVAELTMTARREDCGCLSAELSTTLDEAEAAKLMRSAAERLDGGTPGDETVSLQAAAIARALEIHRPEPARYFGTDLNPSRRYDCAGCGEGRAYPCRTALALGVEG